MCIRSVSPMDTSCAAGACWKLLQAYSCVGFLTQFSHVHLQKPVMSCNTGCVISVWIVESDVRGKRKLVKFQTKRAKVKVSLAATQIAIKTFLFLLFLKALTPSKWLTWTGCWFFWHLWFWAEIYHNLWSNSSHFEVKWNSFIKCVRHWDGFALMKHT